MEKKTKKKGEVISVKVEKSSNITHATYDTSSKELIIEFAKNSKYKYFKVPRKKFKELIEAESIGGYFHANIKDKFKYKKLEK